MRAVGRTLGIEEAAHSFPLAGVVWLFSTPTNEQVKPTRTKRAGIKKAAD